VGLRNQITTLNEQLEYAVRREIKADRIAKIIERLVVAAENGSIQAARIVLDKILPNARVGDGESNTTPMIHVIIQNATHGADKTAERPTVRVYEHETPKTDGEIK
jgi:ribosomal protein L17